MAHVTLVDGRELDVEDSDTTLLDYYRGEGATITDEAVVLRPPYTVDESGNVTEGGGAYEAPANAPVVESVDADPLVTEPTDSDDGAQSSSFVHRLTAED